MSAPNAMVPPARSSKRATTAFPPLSGVPTSTEWRAMRHNHPKPSIWELITNRRPPVGRKETQS